MKKQKRFRIQKIEFELGEPDIAFSVRELKDKFYWWCRIKQKELKERFRDGRKRAINPNILHLNPRSFTDERSPTHVDIYVAVYILPEFTCNNGWFYAKVSHSPRSMEGPHKAELYFKCETGLYLLGCALLRFMFLKKAELKKELRRCIVEKSYFATDATEDEVVTVNNTQHIQI